MNCSRQGFVYCQSNAGLIGYKIGRTIRCTTTRARENSRAYGTLHPFVTVSKHMVNDCVAVETMAHRRLAHCRNAGSEMFECDLKTAQAAIEWAAREVLGRPWYVNWWRSLTAPRPKRAPKRWRRARRSSHGWLWLTLLAAGLIVFLSRRQPELPEWLPDVVAHTVVRIEGW